MSSLPPVTAPPADLARRPLYETVREQLRQHCLSQASTGMLPPLRELSASLNVNHLTVSKALRDLESDGLVEIVPRKGIFIRATAAPTAEIITFLTRQQNLSEISVQMLHGMQETAGRSRISGVTLTVPPFPAADDFVMSLRARGTAALVLLGFNYLEGEESLAETRFIQEVAARMPVVLAGKEHTMLKLDCVYCDPRSQMRTFLDACYAEGARRFGYLGSEVLRPHLLDRYQGFLDFLLDHGLTRNHAYIPNDQETAELTSAKLLDHSPLPEVVVASNLSRAFALVLEAQRRGLRLQKDLKVMCFASSSEAARPILPYATVVMQDEVGVGRRAMQLIQARLKNSASTAPQVLTVPATFLES